MKFTTHNDAVIETSGTFLQGYIIANYADLVEAFGQPHNPEDYKTDAEWDICFEDGTRATVYNWKNGKNYCGKDGLAVEDIEDWNVGGFNKDAIERVMEVVYPSVRNADIDEYDEGDTVPDHWAIDN